MRKNLIVMQEGGKDCGAACLLSIVRFFGGDISLDRIVDMVKTTKDGTNFYNISEAAGKFGIITKCFKVDDIEKIKSVSTPFIVQVSSSGYNHFIVVYKINNNKVTIMDPARGKCNLDIFDFSNIWTGYIMLFEKVGNIPKYNGDKLLNEIVSTSLKKNINIILFLIILSIIFTVISCVLSLYSEIVFDKVINTNINNLIIVTIFFSILFIVKNITGFIRNHLVIYLNQKLDISIILSAFSKIILLPYNFYVNKRVSEVLTRINDLSYVKNFISKIIITIFLDFLMFIISFVIIYSVNRRILLLFFIIDILYFLIVIIFNGLVRKNTVLNQENSAKVNSQIIESVSNFETIKGLDIEDNIIFKFSKIYSKSLNNLYYSEKINNIIILLKEVVTDIGMLFISFITIKFVMDNILTTGSYMTIIFMSNYLIYPVRNIIDILSEYHYVKGALERANNLLLYDEERIYDEEKLSVNGNIKVKCLNYTYNNKYYVLKDVNLFVKDKERVLILGESGCGKSTIMKILYKYCGVDRGSVYINNYDINDYSMSDIRKHITYISQNEMLFTGSIRENILLDREVTEIDFLNICKILHIDEIVENSILGYEYPVEEGGVNLSGGQRQRIILARSLLKNSNIIMIDEGLNQIDIKLERGILINIFNYFHDKTFIIISHRKENIDLYDRIVKMGNGKVKEVEEKYKV